MNENLAPTKGNLIFAKNTLALSRLGYDLLDRKRNILIREMMSLIDEAKRIQSQIDETFQRAYKALQIANVMLGIDSAEDVGFAVARDDSIKLRFRSVMGVELPTVIYDRKDENTTDIFAYGLYGTSSALDAAFKNFESVKQLTLKLAEVENSVFRLGIHISKTQRRVNALKNISIPFYEQLARTIQDTLEEKEREEFSRLKMVKAWKNSNG